MGEREKWERRNEGITHTSHREMGGGARRPSERWWRRGDGARQGEEGREGVREVEEVKSEEKERLRKDGSQATMEKVGWRYCGIKRGRFTWYHNNFLLL